MELKYRPRILIIDDDDFWRQRISKKLIGLKNKVAAPEGIGENLVKSAIDTAKAFRPHVVIIDIDLRNAGGSDTSGFDVLNNMDKAECIIYSAYLRWEYASDPSLKERVTFISKSSSPDLLMEKVQLALQKICASRKEFKIYLPDKYTIKSISRHLSEAGKPVSAWVIPEVIVGCFPNEKSIQLETLSGSAESPNQASRGRSLVLKAHPKDRNNPVIIKFSRAEKIHNEYKHYIDHVEGNLGGFFYADLRSKPYSFWELGGLVYTFLGDKNKPLITFSNHYTNSATSGVAFSPLEHFFNEVSILHYKNKSPHYKNNAVIGEHLSLYNSYNEYFKLNEKIPAKEIDITNLEVVGVDLPLKNPVSWISHHKGSSRIPGSWYAVTHGDLHADNLFTEGEHAWAIDYERCGEGPILRDFAELEVDLLTRVLYPDGMDIVKFFGLAIHLFLPEFSDPKKKPSKSSFPDPETLKTGAIGLPAEKPGEGSNPIHRFQGTLMGYAL